MNLRHRLGRNGIPKSEIVTSTWTDILEHPSHPEPPWAGAVACSPVSEETSRPLLENPVKRSPGEDKLKNALKPALKNAA